MATAAGFNRSAREAPVLFCHVADFGSSVEELEILDEMEANAVEGTTKNDCFLVVCETKRVKEQVFGDTSL